MSVRSVLVGLLALVFGGSAAVGVNKLVSRTTVAARCRSHPRGHVRRCKRCTDRWSPAVSKRTFQPNNRRRAKTHGFRLRMRTRAGRAIIAARRRKGRSELSA